MSGIPTAMKQFSERFWSYVDRRGPDDCWNWRTQLSMRAPTFRIGPKKHGVHQLALIFSGSPRPDGLGALHSCDNSRCCNPAHLRWGTQAENMGDKRKRGRAANRHGSARGSAMRRWLDHWTAF